MLRLTQDLARIYAKAFDEVGAGEGGDETAYLVHLQLIEALRQALHSAPPERRVPASLLALSSLDLATQAALEPAGRPRPPLGARLGLQFAAMASPACFGAEDLERRPLNVYRTIPAAVDLARRVVRGPVENIDWSEVVATFTERLRRDPEVQHALTLEILTELVRECGLVLALQFGAWGIGPAGALTDGARLGPLLLDAGARARDSRSAGQRALPPRL